MVDRYGYDAWGVPTLVQESVPQRLRYGGYWWDAELGWYWVSVRHYSPSLRRWLAPDPSQQDGVRTYVYVGDDPVDESDPSGLHRFLIWAAAFISPPQIPFFALGDLPHWLLHTDAHFEGDNRGFWNGSGAAPTLGNHPIGRPTQSSRIWNYVVVDDNPHLTNPILVNKSGVGLSTVKWTGGGGSGYASDSALANDLGSGYGLAGQRTIEIHINSQGGNPLVPGAPDIRYNYQLDFQYVNGKPSFLSIGGSHTQFPWQKLLVECLDCAGRRVLSGSGSPWMFSPHPGANPWDLFDLTYYWPGAEDISLGGL